MTDLFNKIEVKQTRKRLRRNVPCPEMMMWFKLRNRQFFGYKFRRQYSVGKYVVDFYCAEKKLAIEIDGDTHYDDDAIIRDRERQNYLENCGVKFLRFTNKEVMENINGVLDQIVRNFDLT